MGRKKRHWTEDEKNCYYCGGIGYLERINDYGSLVKCLMCDGTGKKAAREGVNGPNQSALKHWDTITGGGV